MGISVFGAANLVLHMALYLQRFKLKLLDKLKLKWKPLLICNRRNETAETAYTNETKDVGMWSQMSCFLIGIFPFDPGNGGGGVLGGLSHETWELPIR